MDARVRVLGALTLFVVMSPTWAASSRTRNFVVTAPTPQLATEIAAAAERFRHDLAIEWLGNALPDWREPCPIVAHVAPNLGAGGRTSFIFRDRIPQSWDMEIQGSRERVLDSVLPHEVTHTIFATCFGRPLPRWADEGACTTVEHHSERLKQEKWLVQFLKTRRGIPFNQMFTMTEYPGDILPLYSQGYSVARFLIAQGGKPKFIQFVGAGLDTSNWASAVRKFYGFQSLGSLQLTWVDWVIAGSKDHLANPPTDTVLASAQEPQEASTTTVAPISSSPSEAPPIAAKTTLTSDTQVALVANRQDRTSGKQRSWYARRQNSLTPKTQLEPSRPLPMRERWTSTTTRANNRM